LANGAAEAEHLMGAQLSAVGTLARAGDYDRYLTAVFAPSHRRETLFALIAFNQEVSRIPEVVSEPMLGRIRLQWWREALDAIYADKPVRHHEVTEPLAAAIRQARLDRGAFDRLLDAREKDLEDDPPADLEALERYARDTGGGLTGLMVEASGVKSDEASTAGERIGTAWALIGLLRAIAHHAAYGRVMLPADRLDAAGLTLEDISGGRAFDRLAPAATPIAARAAELLAESRRRRRLVPGEARPVLLIARLADLYLTRLRHAAYDPRDPRLFVGPLRRQVAMFRGALSRRY
jgi:phytoene synthase